MSVCEEAVRTLGLYHLGLGDCRGSSLTAMCSMSPGGVMHMLVHLLWPLIHQSSNVHPLQVLDQDYDWVFGSDVTYTEETLQPLAKLLRQMILTNEGAVVKLAHMHRNKELDKAMREIFHGELKAQSAVCWYMYRAQCHPAAVCQFVKATL